MVSYVEPRLGSTFFNCRLEVAPDLRAGLILLDYLDEAVARLLKNFLKRFGGFEATSDSLFLDGAGLRLLQRDLGWRSDSPGFQGFEFEFRRSLSSDPFLFPDRRFEDRLEVDRFFGLLPEGVFFG